MVRSEFKLRFVGVSGLHEVLPSIGSVLPERELPEIFVEELIEAASRYLVEPKPENLRWAYKNEVSIQMITKLIHETIDGAGFRLEGDPRACEFVQGVYDSTVNLSEWLEITTENLVIHGNQIWVPRFIDREFIGLSPLDWNEIYGDSGGGVYRHPTFGWTTFVQKVPVPTRIPQTREEWEKLKPDELRAMFAAKTYQEFTYQERDVIYIRIGSRGYPVGTSPIECILTLVAFKKRLEWLMVRAAEIWGAPIMIGKTGTLERLPSPTRPEDWAKYQKRIDEFADLLAKYRNFGVFSLAADQELQIAFPGRGIIDFPRFLQALKTEIVQSLLGSVALFEARGVELATSRTIKSVWNEAVDGWRRLYECALNKQFHPLLLKKCGIKGKCKIVFERGWVTEEDVEKLRRLMKK